MHALRAAALALALLPATLGVVSTAHAGPGTGIGVGVEALLTGYSPADFGGLGNDAAITYQTPTFHVQGLLGFHDDGATAVEIGGRFMWHLHTTGSSDFSLGGGLGLTNVDVGPDSYTLISLEMGAQIRAFVTTNVSLNAFLGIGYLMQEEEQGDDVLALTGDLLGGFGATYYFD